MRNVMGGILLLMAVGVLASMSRPTERPVPAPAGFADRILIDKSERRLDLMAGDRVIRSYGVALGFAPDGDKMMEGDGKTPEGRYAIDGRNPDSAFHLSLKISYPDEADRAAAAAHGVAPGGDIFIHGAPNWWLLPGQPPGDWTKGCIAVTDAEIEDIWTLVADGTPIEITP